MRNLCKLFLALVLGGLCAEVACAQTTVTAGAGSLAFGSASISTGSVVFVPVDSSGRGIAVTKSSGGLGLPVSVQPTSGQPIGYPCLISAGAITGTCSVPDSATSTPSGFKYNVYFYDTSVGNPTSGQTAVLTQVAGVSGATWQLDHYSPLATVQTAGAFTYTQGVGAPSGTFGTNAIYADTTTPTAPVLYTNVNGTMVQFAGGSSAVTATAIATALSSRTGCSTAGYVYSPQSNTCIAVVTNVATALGYTPAVKYALTSGASADYYFTQTSGTSLTDSSGNGNTGTLGAGSSTLPTWTGKGLQFGTYSGGQAGVMLPSALNGSQTVLIVFYANPLPQHSLINSQYETLVTSTLGGSGLNIMASFINPSGNFDGNTYGLSTFAGGSSNTVALDTYSGLHAYTLVCGVSGTSLDHLYLDGVEVATYQAQGASCGKQTSGNLYLGTTNVTPWNNGMFDGAMYRAVFWPSQLTATQVQQDALTALAEVSSRGVSTAPQYVSVGSPSLYCSGDSITYGFGVTTTFCAELSLVNQPAYVITNWGISSVTAKSLAASEPNRVAQYCRAVGGYRPIALVMEGTNDFFSSNSSVSAASVMASYAADIASLSSAGCRVFAGTTLSRTGTSTNGTSFDVNKDSYDALILAGAKAAGAEGVIDYAADARLGADGANTNTTYFQADKTHPTQAGVDIMAGIASNSLNYYNSTYSLANPNVVSAAAYQMLSGDRAITVTPSAAMALTAPDCTGPSGESYTISNPQSAYAVTVIGKASQPINGLATAITIPNNSTVVLRDVPNPKSTSGCHWVM